MIINDRPPQYPRKGPSCLFVLFVIFGVAVGFFMIQNREEVLEIITSTATPEPTRSATEYALLASLSLDDDELEEALGYYEEAIRLDATKPQLYIDLINLYVETGQPQDALRWAEDGVLLAPDDEEMWTAYAAAHLANGDRLYGSGDGNGANLEYAAAVGKAEKAIDLNPQNATAMAYLAGGMVFQGIPELYPQAQAIAEEASFLEPDNALTHLYLAEVYTNQGNYDGARQQWQLGIQADERNPDLYIGLALNFYADGRLPDAILRYKEAIELDPDNAIAYDGLAFMYFTLGQHNLAVENALIAIEKDPTMARAYGRLGEAYYLQNNYENAVDALTEATRLYGEPNSANARFFYYLGSSYLFLGTENCPQTTAILREVADFPSFFQDSAQEALTECRRVELEQGS